jgi:glycosyltransferase involved in cell wall biosynthesis
MKIALVTDAWLPQVNGVVTTLQQTSLHLNELGHQVARISPEQFRTMPCPGYPEIRLSVLPGRKVSRDLERIAPDVVHIATEGPLGRAARDWCVRNDFPFATSCHTRFPEYLRMRAPIPLSLSYAVLRHFHAPAHCTLVRTRTQKNLLEARGFGHLSIWPGAVDCDLFRPLGKDALFLPRPISMYMGRVSVEKNLEAFLDLQLPGTQVVVGDGPELQKLRRKYPAALFTGARFGVELARTLSAADVFVFPSRTDTLGLVMLEAMACGVPVAAFPVPGPADLLTEGGTGAMDEDLGAAVFRALALDGEACIEFAREFSWRRSTENFLALQSRQRVGTHLGAMAVPG